ncbi:MAG: FtsX-like permease family protein [bacterium]|nr:FtsX-like permease family protein [bacterium]
MKIWLKLALRELLNHRGFSLFFLANLTIGLVGFITLDSFKLSLDYHIDSKAKSLLAADLMVSTTHPFRDDETALLEEVIPQGSAYTEQLNFMSMVRGPKSSRLVEIVAVSAGYPFYGQLTLKDGPPAGPDEVEAQLLSGYHSWVQPELLQILGVEQGHPFSLGEQQFSADQILLEAPGQSFWNAGITYKVFIGMPQAAATGLLQRGSRRYYHRLYRLPPGTEAREVAAKLYAAMGERLGPNGGLRIKTHEQANEQMSRMVLYLNDYLGLVSLVALFLAGLGTAFLFRNFLGQRLNELAILRALGAKPMDTLKLSLLQISLLGSLAAVLASAFALLGLPFLTSLLVDYLPLGFESQLSYRSMFLALVVGIVGSALFCLPLLLNLLSVSPKLLLQDQTDLRQQAGLGTWTTALSYGPVLLLYWGLSVWQSQSLRVGSMFMGGLAGSAILLTGLGLLPLLWAGRGFSRLPLSLRLALRNLGRGGAASVTSVVAIGLGALLINLIPQIHQGLSQEIQSPDQSVLPSFFLLDIQPEQIGPLNDYVRELGFPLEDASPMVSARLKEINGKDIATQMPTEGGTREEEAARRTLRRDQNLSYRAELYHTEGLVEGRWFEGDYHLGQEKLPEISLEQRFAERLGVGLGSTMTFDVMGIPIKGKITSLRRVHWNAFEPNFFVLFQPGVLEMAPAVWLGTLSKVPEERKVSLQAQISEKFPNVSLINVSGLIKKILQIAEQIRWAIQSMALLSLVAGLVVVYSIASFNAKSREQELNLLKILGASFGDLRVMTSFEFGLLGFFAASAGAFLSLVISWGLAQFIFDRIFVVNLSITWATVLLITLLSLATSLLATGRALAKSPAKLLQAL